MGIGSIAEGPLVSSLVACLLVGYLLLVVVVVAAAAASLLLLRENFLTVLYQVLCGLVHGLNSLRGTQRSSCTAARRLQVH
jgi:hypothetical protein